MTTDVQTQVNTKVIANLLRGLAIDVETNAVLGVRVVEALIDARILTDDTDDLVTGEYPTIDEENPNGTIPPGMLAGMQVARLDMATLYRVGGADQVRERLATLDVAALKRLIQVQQLDPEKKTSKLRSAAKLIDFIVELVGAQVQAEIERSRTASWML
jgi:hypothetical protein